MEKLAARFNTPDDYDRCGEWTRKGSATFVVGGVRCHNDTDVSLTRHESAEFLGYVAELLRREEGDAPEIETFPGGSARFAYCYDGGRGESLRREAVELANRTHYPRPAQRERVETRTAAHNGE